MAPSLTHIKETCLYVNNLETTRKFYEEIMGLQPMHYEPGKFLFIRIGQDMLLFFNAEESARQTTLPPHDGKGRQHIAFECPIEEYEAWKTHLTKHKIGIEFETDWPKGGKSFYFRDPDMLCLEIVQPGIWGF